MKSLLRSWHQARFRKLSAKTIAKELGRSALVFAPHQDDEVLGCGGTVLSKRAAGASVRIVFVTDGSESHRGLIGAEELAGLRMTEAFNAAEVLGIAPSAVTFLGFKDGQTSLPDIQAQAVEAIARIFGEFRPREIYLPYRHETHPDHFATFTAVMKAIEDYPEEVELYEYPVWFMRFYPWVTFEATGWRAKLRKLKVVAVANFRMLVDFNCAFRVSSFLDEKRRALDCHKSQVCRRGNRAEWTVLQDASNGEFLDTLFLDHEIFSRSTHAGKLKI